MRIFLFALLLPTAAMAHEPASYQRVTYQRPTASYIEIVEETDIAPKLIVIHRFQTYAPTVRYSQPMYQYQPQAYYSPQRQYAPSYQPRGFSASLGFQVGSNVSSN